MQPIVRTVSTCLCLALCLSACSQKQAYQGMQEAGKQQNCRSIIDELEKQKCEQGYEKDFETYKKERERVLNK
ncbi:hypothetical protein [Catenovulum sediminis]|uniref:Lipoprotein n=1 Tax=Catenovulum sediminis TaxID=1740262 RepID=A0ABV1RHI1_9ALTE